MISANPATRNPRKRLRVRHADIAESLARHYGRKVVTSIWQITTFIATITFAKAMPRATREALEYRIFSIRWKMLLLSREERDLLAL